MRYLVLDHAVLIPSISFLDPRQNGSKLLTPVKKQPAAPTNVPDTNDVAVNCVSIHNLDLLSCVGGLGRLH